MNNEKIAAKILPQIESQVSHIVCMYEKDELENKMIELAHEWFYKGVTWGINHKNETE
jgi:hypothetical protein